MLQKLRTNKEGFTLIELMIVIAIIGILAAIAIPNFISYRDKAFCSAAESDVNAIAAAIADYFSVPSQTGWDNLTNATTVLGIELSGSNTANVTRDADGDFTIAVTDASQRCPTDYQGAVDGWASGVYTKNM